MYRLAIASGSRADYGLLRPLINTLGRSGHFDIDLFVTGSHLSDDHGLTKNEICTKHLDNIHEIPCALGATVDVAVSVAQIMTGVSEVLKSCKAKSIIILGDRFEAFAFAQAAYYLSLPIFHLHGGEITTGSFDDGMRHCITKMSSLHFTSNATYRERVIQMGEHPSTVFNVGSLAVENAKNLNLLTKGEVERRLKFALRRRNILITHHPVTNSNYYKQEIDQILTALGMIKQDLGLIFTSANADPGGEEINQKIKNFVKKSENAIFIDSMGSLLYLSTLSIVNGVIGNSSSGIYEAPLFGKWVLNVGPRQNGRVRPGNVIDHQSDEHLVSVMKKLIEGVHPACRIGCSEIFGDGTTSSKITEIILDTDIAKIKSKSFFDLGVRAQND